MVELRGQAGGLVRGEKLWSAGERSVGYLIPVLRRAKQIRNPSSLYWGNG